MIYRCILPEWAIKEYPSKNKVLEGEFSDKELTLLNKEGYNIYFLPNYPSVPDLTKPINGSDIDTFRYLYVDMDLKEGKYKSKEEFISILNESQLLPTLIIDSGNGIHAYWSVKDLDAMSFLRLQRRMIRFYNTDEAVCKIYQLMRTPNTINTKDKNNLKPCTVICTNSSEYISEHFDNILPKLSKEDEEYCINHYNKTFNIQTSNIKITYDLPKSFIDLLHTNNEVKSIWAGGLLDRSKGDYRLAHIMYASNISKKEATEVLMNSAKALGRSDNHRISYATNIVDKIWQYEETENKDNLNLSNTVRQILNKYGDDIKGIRFPCWSYLDNTYHGFRLGQVIGLVAGSGVGKTAIALNMFKGFVQNNPDYDHFFVPLEQPANEIADRWKTMCQNNTNLYDKVHIISNYDDSGNFRHLSLDEIKDYVIKFQDQTQRKVGCVVIDHIGALKKKGKNGEHQDLMDICHSMKAFAVQTNTMLVMQSQAPRAKAGIGDLELDKDAAYGTVYFESYCDYLITLWQPLKRCYNQNGCPTITAFKFCKIRHKKKLQDKIQEDTPYILFFDSTTEHLRECTEIEQKAFDFWNIQATNKRKADKKTDVVSYMTAKWENPQVILDAKSSHN